MPDSSDIAKWLAGAIGAVQGVPAQSQNAFAAPIQGVLDAPAGERGNAANAAVSQLGGQALHGLGKVASAALTNPARAIIEQEEAKLAKKQAAAAALGIDPETGLPMPAPAQPAAAAPVAPAPLEPAAQPVQLDGKAPVLAHKAVSPANSVQSAGMKGPYDQSPSMLPGTDPAEIEAAKRAADKKTADDAAAAEEKELKDAFAANQAAHHQSFLGNFITSLASPDGKLRAQQLAEADAPLQALMQRREQLGKLRTERGQREEQDRQRAINDPDSELSKVSATALRAIGVPVPKGYTASMFNDMKALSQLSSEQRHKAAEEVIAQSKATEDARHNRAGERNDAARVASEHEARLLAAGAPEKAVRAAQLQQVEAYNKATNVANELKSIVDAHGTVPLDPEARGRVAQLQHELATLAVQAKSKPGVVPRPNAVEEEMHVLPAIGTPTAILHSKEATKNLIDSFVKGVGGEAGVAPEAPAGGAWSNAQEARLQELQRKLAAKGK